MILNAISHGLVSFVNFRVSCGKAPNAFNRPRASNNIAKKTQGFKYRHQIRRFTDVYKG